MLFFKRWIIDANVQNISWKTIRDEIKTSRKINYILLLIYTTWSINIIFYKWSSSITLISTYKKQCLVSNYIKNKSSHTHNGMSNDSNDWNVLGRLLYFSVHYSVEMITTFLYVHSHEHNTHSCCHNLFFMGEWKRRFFSHVCILLTLPFALHFYLIFFSRFHYSLTCSSIFYACEWKFNFISRNWCIQIFSLFQSAFIKIGINKKEWWWVKREKKAQFVGFNQCKCQSRYKKYWWKDVWILLNFVHI